jgi:hypothetical protein
MVTVGEVFDGAMSLMDELNSEGSAQTSDTKEYEYRSPGIINALIAEKRIICGEKGAYTTVTELEDPLLNIEDSYARVVLPYGLAANLLIDENPTSASFFEQRYEEIRDRFLLRQEADTGEVTDVYGGIEYGEFSRW